MYFKGLIFSCSTNFANTTNGYFLGVQNVAYSLCMFFYCLHNCCRGGGGSPANILVTKVKDDVYIRTPYREDGVDKVWRLKVGAKPDLRSSGVIDFIGERLISSKTISIKTVSAYHKTGTILRYGQDESPPLWINGKIVGGNHRLNDKCTVHEYTVSMKLDRNVIVDFVGKFFTGQELTVEESYKVSFGDENDIASVKNQYSFNHNPYCRFRFFVRAEKFLKELMFGGMQFQRPHASEDQRLILHVPESKWNNGIDITDAQKELTLTPEEWTDESKSPNKFIVEFRKNDIVQYQFTMGYESGVITKGLATAFYRSTAGKMYPRAVQVSNVESGEIYAVTGFFGVNQVAQ